MERVLETWVSGTHSAMEKWVEQGFSSFFGKFLPYIFDDFSKCSTPEVLWNFEKSANIEKNQQKMKKSFVRFFG